MLAFNRVVELKSFTKVAVSLNITKATLSAEVDALDKRLNVKLLHRTTHPVNITNYCGRQDNIPMLESC